MRSAKSISPCAREGPCRNRSRSVQLPQGDSVRAHAAGRSHPSLVPTVRVGAGNPQPLPETAGSGTLANPPPQRTHSGFGSSAPAAAFDSAFRYFLKHVDVAALSTAIRDRTIEQIPDGAADLDQLVCNGKTLRGSIVPTAGGGSAFIAQVTHYSAALGLAIAQACYATGSYNE